MIFYFIRILESQSQSRLIIFSKNTWFSSNPFSNVRAFGLNQSFISIGFSSLFLNIRVLSFEQKGGAPANISQNRAPKLHQSTAFVCPCPNNISGARYSGVPQKVLVISPSLIFVFERPKSVILMCPCQSSNMFSGFKSRYITPLLCRYSIARINSARQNLDRSSQNLKARLKWKNNSPTSLYNLYPQS